MRLERELQLQTTNSALAYLLHGTAATANGASGGGGGGGGAAHVPSTWGDKVRQGIKDPGRAPPSHGDGVHGRAAIIIFIISSAASRIGRCKVRRIDGLGVQKYFVPYQNLGRVKSQGSRDSESESRPAYTLLVSEV